MSSMHTPSKNPTSPFAASNNPPSTSASVLPHPPSLPFQSPTSLVGPIEPSTTGQSAYFLSVDAVRCMQMFVTYFEGNVYEISELIKEQEPFFYMSIASLQDAELYRLIVDNPDILQVVGDAALRSAAQSWIQRDFDAYMAENPEQKQVLRELFAVHFTHSQRMRILPVDCPQAPLLRELSSVFADRMINLTGLVTRKADAVPALAKAAFLCQNCGGYATVDVSRGAARKPANCSLCNSPLVDLSAILSGFSGSCVLRVQESASDETPVSVQLVSDEILVTYVKPGDYVNVCGILRLRTEYVNSIHRALRAVFKPFIEVLSCTVVKHADSPAGHIAADTVDELDDIPYTDLNAVGQQEDLEDIMRRDLLYFAESYMIPAEIREMAPTTDSEVDERLTKLINSIAPSIFGSEYMDVKLALLLQAVAGVSKQVAGASYRGDIHILLIGDPGQAKSQLLKFMTYITPRSLYTSGKGTSSVGLTAMVTKDENGEYYLEQGALVLADYGLCGLDEFDKLSFGVRAVLHECMEQQTVSIAKAGIIAQLPARTAILAAANPVDSKYNVRKTVVQNINMDPSLLSRFDLIFLLLDDPTNLKKNQDLATHLLGLYFEAEGGQPQGHYGPDQLRRYIGLVKAFKPKISEAAAEQLTQNYLQLRRQSDIRSNRIAALPRQLLSMIRLSEARAKLRFSEYVTVRDVDCAFQLLTSALKASATNENGVLDMRLLMGGVDEVEGLEDAVRAVIYSKKSLTMLELNDTLRNQGMITNITRLDQVLQGLVEDQMIRMLKGQIVLIE